MEDKKLHIFISEEATGMTSVHATVELDSEIIGDDRVSAQFESLMKSLIGLGYKCTIMKACFMSDRR